MCFAVINGRKDLALIAGSVLIKILSFPSFILYQGVGWTKYSQDVSRSTSNIMLFSCNAESC